MERIRWDCLLFYEMETLLTLVFMGNQIQYTVFYIFV